MKCCICKKCGTHHWYFINAIECCQDLYEDKINQKISENKSWKFCRHCNKDIITPTVHKANNIQ